MPMGGDGGMASVPPSPRPTPSHPPVPPSPRPPPRHSEACLEQLTAFQNSLEELAAQFQEFNEAIFEGDYDAFHEHLGNYGVPEAILMDKDELYT